VNKKRVDVKLYAETSLQFCDDGYVVYSLVKTMIGVMLLLTTTTDSQPTDGAVPCSRGLTRYTEKTEPISWYLENRYRYRDRYLDYRKIPITDN